MTSILAAAALVLSSMAAVPDILPLPDPTGEPEQTQPATAQTSAEDGVLRRGCHRYRYGYAVSGSTTDWRLETSVVDRTGKAVAAGVIMGNNHPAAGDQWYDLCRYATRPGRFTITGTVTTYDGKEQTVVAVPETRFRLRGRR